MTDHDPELLARLAPSSTTPADDDLTPDERRAEVLADLEEHRRLGGTISAHGQQAFVRYQRERQAQRRREAEAAPEWVSWMYSERAA